MKEFMENEESDRLGRLVDRSLGIWDNLRATRTVTVKEKKVLIQSLFLKKKVKSVSRTHNFFLLEFGKSFYQMKVDQSSGII